MPRWASTGASSSGPRKPPRRNHFNRLWQKACREAGIKGLHFHDLRHTGNTLAASTGASTRELMTRMGHSTARAGRHLLIADAPSGLVENSRKGHAGLIGGPGTTKGQAEETSSDLALCASERATGIEPA
ncbi:tyrosine-type recombinase/integrase [Streptomyces sp. 2132.2]|uniref:tyrosine-type recombinase/integrase n=1 Tax=Streptomyces sp. 2132.2 TaxID=2485161 RepID=UPI000F48E88E